jgi:hypothetical protein
MRQPARRVSGAHAVGEGVGSGLAFQNRCVHYPFIIAVMKSVLLLLVLATLPCLAQQPAATPSASPAATPAPGSLPVASPTPAGNVHDAAAGVPLPGQEIGPQVEAPIPLMPDTIPSGPRSRHARPGASPAQPATFKTESDIRLRIRIRKVQNRVLNDPATQAEWDAAHRATTDIEFRTLLLVYYNHLYDRILKADPTLAESVRNARVAAINRMKYARLAAPENTLDPFNPGNAGAYNVNSPEADATPGASLSN